jgi:ABC-2 type transport system permease protein
MTTAVLDSRTALRPTPGPRFRDLLRSERTKLASLRSTWWAMGAMVVLALGINILFASLMSADWSKLSAQDLAEFRGDTVGLVLQPGAAWGQVAACILGVMLMASEFSTGMVRATMLAIPRRTPVLAAKALVFGGLLFVLGELIAIPSVLVGSHVVGAHAPLSITDPATVRAVLGFGVYVALLGVFALGVGTIVRHPAAAISAVVAVQFVLPAALGAVPGSAFHHVVAALPANAVELMGSSQHTGDLYTPLQSLLILVGWAAVGLLVAAVTLKKRDV